METAVQTLAVCCALLVAAVLYLTSLVRSANAALKEVAQDAITASRATSATELVHARAFAKASDMPLKDVPVAVPPTPRVFTTPDGTVLEPLRPRR